jgi:uncharacterized RDD family membrane protein YckC
MLDSLLVVETPEGVTLALRLAGLLPRSQAFLIDMLIRFATLLLLARLCTLFGVSGVGLRLLLFFLLEWFYPVFFEVYFNGSTPGKRSIGLTVVERTGLPVGFQASLVRNLLRAADFLPFAYGFGMLAMLRSQHYQRLGDLAANTVVVWKETARLAQELPAAAPIEPPVRLTLDEQQTLVSFAERLRLLSPQRQLELSDLLQPLTGATGKLGLQRALGMANYLAGRR